MRLVWVRERRGGKEKKRRMVNSRGVSMKFMCVGERWIREGFMSLGKRERCGC